MKKISPLLSKKSEQYLNKVLYSLEKPDGSQTTISDAINEILETNSDFEKMEDQSVSGWLRDFHNYYDCKDLTIEEMKLIQDYEALKIKHGKKSESEFS